MVRAFCGNIDLFEAYCIVALMMMVNRNVWKGISLFAPQNLIAFLIAGTKYVIFPTLTSVFLHKEQISLDDHTVIVAKGALAAGLYFTSKVVGI